MLVEESGVIEASERPLGVHQDEVSKSQKAFAAIRVER